MKPLATTKEFQEPLANRYDFDSMLKPSDGWCQLDTRPTAQSYEGFWVNPIKLETLSFTEGDCFHGIADDAEEFTEHLKGVIDWYGDEFLHIDPMANDKNEEAFRLLGFSYALPRVQELAK